MKPRPVRGSILPGGGLAAVRRMARRWRRFGGDTRGNSAVEFALVLPMLMTTLFAIMKFSVAMNNNINLTEGVRVGGRYLASARGGATPYATMVTNIKNSAANLNGNNITITATVDGTACTDATTPTCAAALNTDTGGGTATVTATYPCDLKVLSVDFAPSCKLSSTTSVIIE